MTKNKDLGERLALWEGVSTNTPPQYPPETPFSDPRGPKFTIRRDPLTDPAPHRKPLGPKSIDRRKLALERITIPQYRNQSMRELRVVPRETPKKAYAWYAPELLPSDCTYKTHKKGKTSYCSIIHRPTSLSISCQSRGSTRYILRTAEFRLAELIKLRKLELAVDACDVIFMEEMRLRIQDRRRRILTDAWWPICQLRVFGICVNSEVGEKIAAPAERKDS